ncbi:MAG: Na+/galactose cotransporter [Terracidiphilus sp.]|nr:Na+/galactose cotransporter [Terracidiphilus sp.]MDR3797821.1 Na+/galactose cotransporter [Terracidiphilus sp.]
MPVLASADWLILLIYCFFVLSAGLSLAPAITSSRSYLQAGRRLPGWLCGLALLSASMGSLEVLEMGAAGAKYGLASMGWFALGSIPAMLFAALVLIPVFYGAASAPGAPVRSIPEYLGLRFDQKTRALNAVLFTAMALFSAGISLYAMARVIAALHLFDTVTGRLNLSPTSALLLSMALPAVLVLAYVLLGGLAATMYNQLLQFCVLVAGLLPVVLLGLKRAGGWSGLKAAVPAGFLHGAAHSGAHSIGVVGLVLGVGVVLGGGAWCTDFRLLQTVMAAKNVTAARRAPLVAAALRIFVPLLLILPGLLALGLPTPRTTIVIHNENGAIYHEITVVPPAVEAGQGMVPAIADASGQPVKGADGQPVLDYAMAMPNMLLQSLPTGLLGLGLAALLACLMSGLAASLTASNTVFACDIYQAFLKRDANDKQVLKAGRWAALGGMLLAFAAGFAAVRSNDLLDAVVLVFAVVNAPLFATLLLGALWKRATGHGAFAGLIAGIAAALLHHGTALPLGEQRGIHGGWIKVLHHPASDMSLGLGTAAFAFVMNLLVTVAVSLCTRPRPEAELAGLTIRSAARVAWWKHPETIVAAVILLAAIAANLIFLL